MNSGRLLADRILQHIGSKRSDPIREMHLFLRVLGSPNPGQSFGRGLSGPQATEVSMDPGGSWAATNLTVHSSNSFLGPSFWQRALRSYA